MTDDKPYTGSLDPFEDMTDTLERMGVCYTLAIGIQGDHGTHVWTNSAKFGEHAVVEQAFRLQEALCELRDTFDE